MVSGERLLGMTVSMVMSIKMFLPDLVLRNELSGIDILIQEPA